MCVWATQPFDIVFHQRLQRHEHSLNSERQRNRWILVKTQPYHQVSVWIETGFGILFCCCNWGFSVNAHDAKIDGFASRLRNAETTRLNSYFDKYICFYWTIKIRTMITKILWIHKNEQYTIKNLWIHKKNLTFTKILWIHKILIQFPPKFCGSIKFWSNSHQNFVDPQKKEPTLTKILWIHKIMTFPVTELCCSRNFRKSLVFQ